MADLDLGASILAPLCLLELTAEVVSDELHAVADTQDRNTQLVEARIATKGVWRQDALRPSREDNADGVFVLDLLDRQVVGVDLAETRLSRTRRAMSCVY